jgi:steroid 5-alpha reductase family enzyme/uncharacterized membrane protein
MEIFRTTLLTIIGFAFIGYFLSRIFKRNDIADILWGLGFLSIGVVFSFRLDEFFFYQKFFLICLSLWALRLTVYLFVRNYGKPEDKRYQNWRAGWGKSEPWKSFLFVFCFQALLMGIISLPIGSVLTPTRESEISVFSFLGLGLFLLGMLLESAADFDLLLFKQQKSNGICEVGLWAKSRHPNYLGEILVWWGFAFMALDSQMGYWVLLSPILVSFLLLRVSGVTLTETSMAQSRGSVYEEYRRNTNNLFPFSRTDLLSFVGICFFVFLIDMFFLGFLARDFYFLQLASLAKLDVSGGSFAPELWALGFVYFTLPLGVCLFARNAKTIPSAFLNGGLYGFSCYGVYEFTNLALIQNWPFPMALVDWIWGTLLCAITAAVYKRFSKMEVLYQSRP